MLTAEREILQGSLGPVYILSSCGKSFGGYPSSPSWPQSCPKPHRSGPASLDSLKRGRGEKADSNLLLKQEWRRGFKHLQWVRRCCRVGRNKKYRTTQRCDWNCLIANVSRPDISITRAAWVRFYGPANYMGAAPEGNVSPLDED